MMHHVALRTGLVTLLLGISGFVAAQQPDTASDSPLGAVPDSQADAGAAAGPDVGETRNADNAPSTAPTPAVPAALPSPDSEAEGLYVEFGRGIRLGAEDGRFGLTIRGRVQTRATVRTSTAEGENADILFEVRRARLVFLGDLPDQNLQFYLQLGLSPGDMDPERPIPLRDAVVTWTPLRDLNLRVGQMKVNYSRERVISSSALQFADRTNVNAEFSLDRDVGIQLFSNNFLGIHDAIGWQFGVYGGAGRNRTEPGTGLLYVGRLQFNPLGTFSDSLVEADLTRSRDARLSLGITAGLHPEARRERTNQGAVLGETVRARHYGADILFKYAGLSLQAEWLMRSMTPESLTVTDEDGLQTEVVTRSGLGYFVQVGYVFPNGFELAGRYSIVQPVGDDSAIVRTAIPMLGVGQYFMRHDLKLQADYAQQYVDGRDMPIHEGRLQLQLFF
jgi:phosphate-selective porin OprO and OprP